MTTATAQIIPEEAPDKAKLPEGVRRNPEGHLEPADPGIYDIDWDTYRAVKALNSSSLKTMRQSMLHFKTKEEEPSKKATKFMDMGTAFHYATLEPDMFASEIVADWNINKNKTIYKEWRKRQGDKIVLPAEQIEAAKTMAKKLHSKQATAHLLRSGYPEKTIFWQDPQFGFWCKARIDWIPAHIPGTIVDLKKTISAHPWEFRKSIRKYKYYWQAYWYLLGMSEVTGQVFDQFFWIAWEPDPPFEGNVFMANTADLMAAEDAVYYYRQQYDMALKSGQWPGYDDSVIMLPQDNYNY